MKVSIVVPVYNVSAYIEKCLLSIINQTYTDIECLIVDDASPDDSISKIEKMTAAYEGPITFTIFHHEKNRGISATRNTGLEAAQGEYVYFIDSDDEISPDCIETLVKPVLRDNNIELVQGGFSCVRHNSLFTKQESDAPYLEFSTNEQIRSHFFCKKSRLNIAAWNKLIKKDFLMQYHLWFEEGLLWEDNMWAFFLMKHLKRLIIVQEITYHYITRANSIQTGTKKKKKRLVWGKIYKTIIDNGTPNYEIQELRYYLPKFCYYYVTEYEDKNYQYCYQIFKIRLSNGENKKSLFLLYLTKVMSKTVLTRFMFKAIYYLYAILK